MQLIGKILASHRDGVGRERHGDELFDFTDHPHGLPIGNLTSQFFANIHLDRFDRFVKQELRVPGYVRYVDDFILFGPDRATSHRWGRECRKFLAVRRLELHPDKYRLCRTAEGVDFCGFMVKADGRVKLGLKTLQPARSLEAPEIDPTLPASPSPDGHHHGHEKKSCATAACR